MLGCRKFLQGPAHALQVLRLELLIPSHHSTLGEVSIASSSTASLHLSRVSSTRRSWLLTDTTTRPRPRTPRLVSPVDASAQARWLLDFGFSFGFFWGIY